MKKNYSAVPVFRLIIPIILLFSALVIHSCKRDNKSPISQSISDAQKWYESTYPKNLTNSSLVTQSIGGSRDLSQLIKPDWKHAVQYDRFGQHVFEMPIDPSTKFQSGYKAGAKTYNKAYSRSYYLLMTDSGKYEAFILTIVADSSYVNNDLSKLGHNTYRKLDADFSGIAMYYTPKGAYLGGYGYQNGKIITPSNAVQQTGGQKVIQSVGSGNLKTDNVVETCTDWYQQVTVYYTDGTSWTGDWTYENTTCVYTNDSTSGNGTGSGTGTPGGGGGGSGSSTSTPPPPCPPGSSFGTSSPCTVLPPTLPDAIGGGLKTNNLIPPSDPGVPPPPTTTPCIVPVKNCATITNNVKNPCLKTMVDKVINANITTLTNGLIQKVFGGSSSVNLAYSDAMALGAGVEGYTPPTALDANGNLNLLVNLNANELPHYSQEFIAITIMHESLHAYLTTIGSLGSYQHEAIMTNFVTQMALDLKQMFPNISDADAKNLALGGLDATTGFKDLIASDMGLLGSRDATQLAYTVGSSGTRCNN